MLVKTAVKVAVLEVLENENKYAMPAFKRGGISCRPVSGLAYVSHNSP
jgi:hypothetical protein